MMAMLSGLAAVATNVWLAAWFASALRDPAAHVDLVYHVGIMLFVIEFLSLHSSGMLFGTAARRSAVERAAGRWRESVVRPARARHRAVASAARAVPVSRMLRGGLVAFYLLMVLGFAASTGQWIAAVYFAASVVAKALSAGSVDAEARLRPVAAGIVFLLSGTFAVIAAASWLSRTFPLPAEVVAARPPEQGGLFVDTPQTLLAWGVFYFGATALYNAASTVRGVRARRAR